MDPQESLSLLEKHKAQIFAALPFDPGNKAFIDIMSEGKYDLRSLVLVAGIGSPQMKKGVVSSIPQSFYLSMITSSEPTIPAINILWDGDKELDENDVYHLSPYTMLFNLEERRPARLEEMGNTVTSGRYCLKGYEKREKKADEWIEYNGRDWFIDGTKGKLDESGRFHLAGVEYALKTIRGKSVSLKKVELTILVNPKVALVGCLSDEKGENLIATVEKKTGMTMTEDEVRSFCRGKLEEHEIPSEILIVEPGTIGRTRYGAVSYELLARFLKEKGYKV
jgi:acyl-CoA synthetase (AMP-forming)/AMP-acid ligase II